MSNGDLGAGDVPRPTTPPDRAPKKAYFWIAGVLLLIPVVALTWTSSYAKETPKLGAFPFFFWYQLAWVPVTALLTYAAHRLVLAARGQKDREDAR